MKARDFITPIALYVVAAALLLFRIVGHPPFPYNWEGYTAWGLFEFWDNPTANILRLNQGLMTDSSHSALTVLPAWVGFALGGVGLTSMRVPIALIAAGAVPLLWLAGRRMFGQGVALLAAILLALSPVYLLYGRTATIVGLSLVPALFTIYALLRVLQRPQEWRWVIGLQMLLVLGAYAYAPIRFLWPLSLILLGIEWAWAWRLRAGSRRHESHPRPARVRKLVVAGYTEQSPPPGTTGQSAFADFATNSLRLKSQGGPTPGGAVRHTRALLKALLITAFTLPTILFAVQYAPGANPLTSLTEYYAGRGEQLGALTSNPQAFAYYIELTEEEKAEGGKPKGSPLELAWRLVSRNARDYARLLLDWDTRPALSDHWNPRGRFYPALLVPFFLLGLGYALWRGRKRVGLEYRVLLVLFFGFNLPLLLTSRVHVGRLIFALPPLMLLIALGYAWVTGWVIQRIGKRLSRRSVRDAARRSWGRTVFAALTLTLITGVGWLTWLDYHITPQPGRSSATVAVLKAAMTEAKSRGGVALVVPHESAPVLEEINIIPYRLDLDGIYRFSNLLKSGGQPTLSPGDDPRPPLYLGDVIGRLEKPETMPDYCGNIYYVDPGIEPRFLNAMKKRAGICDNELEYRLLP